MNHKRSILIWVFFVAVVFFWSCASEQLTSARLYIREENWEKAEAMLLAAAEVEPDNPEVYFHLGKEIYARRGEWDKMNEMFDKALSLDPKKKLPTGVVVKDAVEVTRTQLWGDRYNNGAALYNKAIQAEGDERIEFLRQATDQFETAKLIKPEEPKTYKNLVFCYLYTNQPERLSSTIDEALERNPEDAELLIAAAKVLRDEGDSDKTIEYLEKALRLDPDNVEAARFLAEIYYDQGDKEGAIFAYEKAIREDPDNVDLHFNLGVLYLQIKDYDFAEEEFQKVLALDPEDWEAILGIGEAYEQMERWEDAEYYYRKSLRFSPDDPILLRAMARVVYRQGRIDEAQGLLDKAKALVPQGQD
ncbi:MAG: tetratricopeptide repeat protein [Fidelibacterota bacterium]